MQVAIYKGKSRLFNRVVSWWMRGQYSHCEAIVGWEPDGKAICWSSGFLDKGVRKKSIVLTSENWDLFEVDKDPAEVAAWFQAREGRPYDWRGMIGCALRIIPPMSGRWFCSNAVAEALGFQEPWRIEPCQLAAILSTNHRAPT